jgi:hypothetical protein
MSSLATGYRTSEQRESRSPAQIVSLVIGVWWAANGIGALVVDSNFATGRVHGGGDLFGLTAGMRSFICCRASLGSSPRAVLEQRSHTCSLPAPGTASWEAGA